MLKAADVRKMHTDIQAKLDEIGPELGLKLSIGDCRYGVSAIFKLEATPLNDDGSAETQSAADFKRYAARSDNRLVG